MCATCGCSDGTEVRITDPVTGRSVRVDPHGAGDGPHEHTDEQGRVYTHTHDEPAREPA